MLCDVLGIVRVKLFVFGWVVSNGSFSLEPEPYQFFVCAQRGTCARARSFFFRLRAFKRPK